ncbi:ABC transporter substrate-binding protein [Maribellus sp. CM-23]|uniref:ABC transporter substrate-binding protein n=1 Tax=Maribellus sp. CM-23 TaxID=2781026 RepID=UPI001F3F4871|nr:helical backbone metal receptor [Maribellus sp. CM-23]MCE4565363.1 ABC transporter substrate-binding protein [Maribellus sp. CM-23]
MRRFVFLFLSLISVTVFSQEVKRVVSLAPSVTDNIYLLGGNHRLVGCTSYCLRAVDDGVAQVGSAVQVNVEKVFALRPDLVITMQLTKPQDIESLRKLGIRVEVMHTPKSFEEICEQTMTIAQLIGLSDKAEEIVNNAKQRVAEIRQLSRSLPSGKVFFQIGASPIYTVLQNTYMNDYITSCGATNIAEGLKVGTLSRESVVLKKPDVIIIAEMGGYGKNEKEVWETYGSIPAVKNGKVFLISSETSCSPSPVNFVSALEDVYRFIKN